LYIFLFTLPVLLLLGISYSLTSRSKLLSLEFAFWLISYQFLFIALLGIGLIQSHIGCPMPLEECYVEGHPAALDLIKLVTEVLLLGWLISAVGTSVFNLMRIRHSAEATHDNG
tara:strand:+ start:213 stop:554 length:342 start_codon:yes stop_codon:yes gene_type:complete